MKPFNPKPRDCAICSKSFLPRSSFHAVCSPKCAAKKVKRDRADERAQIKTRREAIKTIAQLIAEAQREFNAYIRARDAGKPCICCGKPLEANKPGGSMDAGHYLSRGAAGHLRFNEDNVFGQRKNCNRPGGTTRAAFRAGVIERIGLEAVEALESDNTVKKWTADELREIKRTYAAKRRELEKSR